MKYNHLVDVAFQLDSDHEDLTDVPLIELVKAMLKRCLTILEENNHEAFGSCEVINNEIEGFSFEDRESYSPDNYSDDAEGDDRL